MPDKKQKSKRKLDNKNSQKSEPPKKRSRHNSHSKYTTTNPNPFSQQSTQQLTPPECPNLYISPSQSPTLTHIPSQPNYKNKNLSKKSNNTRPKNKKSNHKSTHKNHRKNVPSLQTSQASLPPSTPTPPIPNTKSSSLSNQTHDVRTNINYASEHGIYNENTDTDKDNICMDFCDSFGNHWWFWIIIGSVIGFSVAYVAIWIGLMPTHNGHAKQWDNYIYVENDGACPCDINANKTCIECKKCLDKYWNMHGIYLDCMNDKEILEKEIIRLQNEMSTLCNNELTKCNEENKKLREELKRLKNETCKEYKKEIGVLKHELGECNVEWDSCEQFGRQKDKLDEKRVEEIQKQKKKFELCNDQLKRYKDKAKKLKKKK